MYKKYYKLQNITEQNKKKNILTDTKAPLPLPVSKQKNKRTPSYTLSYSKHKIK